MLTVKCVVMGCENAAPLGMPICFQCQKELRLGKFNKNAEALKRKLLSIKKIIKNPNLRVEDVYDRIIRLTEDVL